MRIWSKGVVLGYERRARSQDDGVQLPSAVALAPLCVWEMKMMNLEDGVVLTADQPLLPREEELGSVLTGSDEGVEALLAKPQAC